MSGEEPKVFLKLMRDNSDNDIVRLVFADWLEERGDPLGEFIRIQVELSRCQNDNREALETREHELLSLHGQAWATEQSEQPVLLPSGALPFFHRGLYYPGMSIYRVIVNYGQSLQEMIEAGNYTWYNDNITGCFGGLGIVKTNVVLVHFNCRMTIDEVIREMVYFRLQPAQLEYLLAYGAQCWQQQWGLIVSLQAPSFSRFTYLNGLVPNGRQLLFSSLEDCKKIVFHNEWHFLAIRIPCAL